MPYFLLISLTLLIGFVILTAIDMHRGVRIVAPLRDRLDHSVDRVIFITKHVDFEAFARDKIRRFAIHIGHDTVRVTLQIVRFIERLLTRLARKLRMQQHIDLSPHETDRPFVKALSDFKGHLRDHQPAIPDILEKE